MECNIFWEQVELKEYSMCSVYSTPESGIAGRRSGYCYLNKGECNLNQSKDDSFVERVVKNNS